MFIRRAGVVAVLLAVFTATAYSGETVKWLSLKDGRAKAKAEGKPSIVDFYFGAGCPRCEFLDKEVYGNPVIAKKINEEFVPIRIDLKKKLTKEENELGLEYDYKNDCMLLFLDPDGHIAKDALGKKLCFIDKVDPDWFIKYLEMTRHKITK